MRDMDRRIAGIEVRIKAVAQSRTGLVELFGVGPVLAATLFGEVGFIAGSPASTTSPLTPAPTPLEASSGQVVRHGLSRAGDRKLNHALDMIAIVQIAIPRPGRPITGASSPRASLPKKRCGV
jgi:transposase